MKSVPCAAIGGKIMIVYVLGVLPSTRQEALNHRITQLATLLDGSPGDTDWLDSISRLSLEIRSLRAREIYAKSAAIHEHPPSTIVARRSSCASRRSARSPRRATRASAAPPGDDGGDEPPGDPPHSRAISGRSEVACE
jgi:hypothetical protein